MSSSSLDEVSTTTGINFVLGSERSCFNTSRPLNFGSFRSRRMTAGICSRLRPSYWPLPKTNSSASLPSRVTTISLAIFACLSARRVSSSSSGLSSTTMIIFWGIASPSFSIGPLSTTGSRSPVFPPSGLGLRHVAARFFHAIGFEREVERGALARLGIGPDPAAMPVHDALDRRQPDPCALILVARVQALERAKELVGVRHVKAGAVVAHVENRAPIVAETADLYAWLVRLCRELPRIPDQVLERRPQQPRIRVRTHAVPDGDVDLALWLTALQLVHHLPGQLAHVGVAPLEAAARYAREVEQVLDQLPHALRGGTDARQIALCLFRHILREVLHQRLAKAVD